MRGRVGAPVDRDDDAGRERARPPGRRSRGRGGRGRASAPSPRSAAAPRRPGRARPSRGRRRCRRRSTRAACPRARSRPRAPTARAGARAGVVGVGRAYRDRADRDLVAGPQLCHVPKPAALQVLRRAGRRDEPDVRAEPQQRARIEVVAVLVRDEHRVGGRELADRRSDAAQVRHPSAEQRVGQQHDPVHRDEDAAVADLGDLGAAARAIGQGEERCRHDARPGM